MLTQAELAERVGISRGEISHLERGRRQPLVTTLRRLCEVLKCEPGDLITSEGNPRNGSDVTNERPAL
jgi:putative transcriptional regulator